MKKTFTLLASFGIIAFAVAQPGNRDKNYQNNDQKNVYSNNSNQGGGYDKDNRNGRYNDRFNNRNDFSERARDIEIARINRAYDHKIDHVNNDRFMSRRQKMRQLNQLEDGRRNEIKMVYRNFNNQQKNHRHH